MKSFEDITCVRDGAVATIAINRPDRLNAFRDQTATEIHEAIVELDADSAINAVILTGSGRAFGAGYDLSRIAPDEIPALDQVLELYFNPMIRAIRRSRLPFIAQVNGPCAGAAVGFALAADIVLAARSAYFYEPFNGIALVPDAGNTLFLPRAVGRLRALPMMLLGDRISAEQAHAWGLVWQLCEDDQLADATRTMAARIAALAPQAVAGTKQLVSAASDFDMDEQLDLERDLQGDAGRSPAMKAEIAAFFARKNRKS